MKVVKLLFKVLQGMILKILDDVDTLSDLVKSIADVLKRRIRRLKCSVNTTHESIFCDPRLSENFPVSMRTLS